jgi:hypothetical protein
VSKLDYAKKIVAYEESAMKSNGKLAEEYSNISDETFRRARAHLLPQDMAVGVENETTETTRPDTNRLPKNRTGVNGKIYTRPSTKTARLANERARIEAEAKYEKVCQGLDKLCSERGMSAEEIQLFLEVLTHYMANLPLWKVRKLPKEGVTSELRAEVAKLDADREALKVERTDLNKLWAEVDAQLDAGWAGIDAERAELARLKGFLDSAVTAIETPTDEYAAT